MTHVIIQRMFFFVIVDVALILHIEVWEFRVLGENKPIYKTSTNVNMSPAIEIEITCRA